MLKLIINIILVITILPFVVFWCMKFGTFAFYKGQKLAKKDSTDVRKEL